MTAPPVRVPPSRPPSRWLGLSEAQRVLLLSVLIGTCAGLLVVCFHIAIEMTSWYSADLAQGGGLGLLVPALGALAAAVLVRYAFPDARGSGIVRTKVALYASNGYIPTPAIPGKFVACTLSIGTGTPLGPEDPSLLMGSAVASRLGRLLGLSRASMRLIAPVGAAAGIAAAFNTPITGVLFVIEEVVAAWNGTVLGSVVLAAVAGVVTTRAFLGDSPLFRVPDLSGVGDPRELLVYVALGLAAGLLSAIFVRVMGMARRRWAAWRSPLAMAGPFVAGLLVGAAALSWPDVLGPGYRGIDSALHGQFDAATLVALGLVKLLLVVLAFSTGTPGGLFAPTLFIGAMLGGAAGALAPGMVPFAASSPATYVLAGMGAVFAGVFRAPMTAVFMAFEVSATYVAIVPAMVTSTVAYLVARALQSEALLELIGRDEGMVFPSAQGEREMAPLHVEDAMRALEDLDPEARAGLERVGRASALHPDQPLDAALRRLAVHPLVPVVSRVDPDRVLGVVTLSDVHRAYGVRVE